MFIFMFTIVCIPMEGKDCNVGLTSLTSDFIMDFPPIRAESVIQQSSNNFGVVRESL